MKVVFQLNLQRQTHLGERVQISGPVQIVVLLALSIIFLVSGILLLVYSPRTPNTTQQTCIAWSPAIVPVNFGFLCTAITLVNGSNYPLNYAWRFFSPRTPQDQLQISFGDLFSSNVTADTVQFDSLFPFPPNATVLPCSIGEILSSAISTNNSQFFNNYNNDQFVSYRDSRRAQIWIFPDQPTKDMITMVSCGVILLVLVVTCVVAIVRKVVVDHRHKKKKEDEEKEEEEKQRSRIRDSESSDGSSLDSMDSSYTSRNTSSASSSDYSSTTM